MEKTAVVKNVDEYLEQLPADQRNVLQKLRNVIRATAPKSEEVISYNMPGYKYHGHLVFFAAFKKHCSLFGMSKHIMKTFEKELASFTIAGSTLQFTTDKPLPATLVKKMIKMKMKENEKRNPAKKPSRSSKK